MRHTPTEERSRVRYPDLDEKRRRLTRPSRWLWLAGLVLELPGILLVVVGDKAVAALGWALIAVGAVPVVIAIALSTAGAVGWWAARGKPFA